MSGPQVQNDPVYSLPFTYISGLAINYATATTITVGAGQCRDSNDVIDMPVGSAPLNGAETTAPITINAAANGVNGLDQGTFAEATGYYVYLIGASNYANPVAALISTSAATPLMPFGYDSYRLIGWVRTLAGSAHFAPFDFSGSSNGRKFLYQTPIIMAAGVAITSTTVSLEEVTSDVVSVPAVGLGTAVLNTRYTPDAAGNILSIKGYDGTAVVQNAGQIDICGIVTAVVQNAFYEIIPGLDVGVPSITYIMTAAGTQTTYIVGYTMAL